MLKAKAIPTIVCAEVKTLPKKRVYLLVFFVVALNSKHVQTAKKLNNYQVKELIRLTLNFKCNYVFLIHKHKTS